MFYYDITKLTQKSAGHHGAQAALASIEKSEHPDDDGSLIQFYACHERLFTHSQSGLKQMLAEAYGAMVREVIAGLMQQAPEVQVQPTEAEFNEFYTRCDQLLKKAVFGQLPGYEKLSDERGMEREQTEKNYFAKWCMGLTMVVTRISFPGDADDTPELSATLKLNLLRLDDTGRDYKEVGEPFIETCQVE